MELLETSIKNQQAYVFSSVPSEETGTNVNDVDYLFKALVEALAFILQLRDEFGQPPTGSEIGITYDKRIHCYYTYDDDDQGHIEYLTNIQSARKWHVRIKIRLDEYLEEFFQLNYNALDISSALSSTFEEHTRYEVEYLDYSIIIDNYGHHPRFMMNRELRVKILQVFNVFSRIDAVTEHEQACDTVAMIFQNTCRLPKSINHIFLDIIKCFQGFGYHARIFREINIA